MKFLSVLFFILVFPLGLMPETQVSLSATDHSATIGDRIRINIIAKTSLDIDAISLDIPKKDFELISQEALPERKSKNYAVFETRLVLSFFSTGDFTIGPFEVKLMKNNRIRETKKTNSLEIRIRSVLEKGDRDIKDLKTPIPLRGNPFYILKYVLFFLLALILIGILIFFLRRRKQRRSLKSETILSPLEELQAAISELKEKQWFEKGRFKPFFIRLTDIIKHYLYREYGFNAEDFTSSETLSSLEKRDTDPRLLENLESLFTIADLVKFAKVIPTGQDYRKVIIAVDVLVSIQKTKFYPPESQDVSVAI
jgi:hypothetical protein